MFNYKKYMHKYYLRHRKVFYQRRKRYIKRHPKAIKASNRKYYRKHQRSILSRLRHRRR